MENVIQYKTEYYNSQHRRKRVWLRVVTVLAAIVVFFTTYALILPAITWENQLICEKSEHAHSDECFGDVSVLSCDKQETISHQHGITCYDENGILICEETESAGHTHGKNCYKIKRELVCGKEAHVHTDACFDAPADAVTGFVCGKTAHEHDASCFFSDGTLQCTIKEHVHTRRCVPQKIYPVVGVIVGVADLHGAKPNEIIDPFYRVDYLNSTETGPLNVEDYVIDHDDKGNKTQVRYRLPGEEEWREITPGTSIPGDAAIRIDVLYADVTKEDLIAAGGKLIYQIPSFLQDPVVDGTIIDADGVTVAGYVTVENGIVTISFTDEWVSAQGNLINGSFFVETEIDITEVEETSPGGISIGDITVEIPFVEDISAQYANVSIQKDRVGQLVETADGAFITYTLTVTAGEDGCPDVRVIDEFTQNAKYIDSYVNITGLRTPISEITGVTETGVQGTGGNVFLGIYSVDDKGNFTSVPQPAGADAQTPGALIWEIGAMQPGETRTLTYTVRLVDDYIGIMRDDMLINVGSVYSKVYERDSDEATYQPKITNWVDKGVVQSTQLDDGSYKVDYKITIRAWSDNSYSLKNLEVEDDLNASYSQAVYDLNSFVVDGLPVDAGDIVYDHSSNKVNFPAGDLAPGQTITVTYSVLVTREAVDAATTASNNGFALANHCLAYDDKNNHSRDDEGYSHGLDWHDITTYLGRKVWDRKVVGEQVHQATTIPMNEGDAWFDVTSGTVHSISHPASFTIPADSYSYTVIVNETGDWDVSSATLHDQLASYNGQSLLLFAGWIRVDAYEIDPANTNIPTSSSDAQVIAKMNELEPTKTVWVYVDNLSSFTFTPNQIGLGDGEYAVKMEYHAKPNSSVLKDITKVEIGNDFTLSGTVGHGGHYLWIGGIHVSKSVEVRGSKDFKATKQPWYYDPTPDGASFPNGTLYWAIRVDGTNFKAGTKFQESTNAISGSSAHFLIKDESLIGIYYGNLGNLDNGTAAKIADRYETIDDLLASELSFLDESYYTLSYSKLGSGNYDFTMTVTKSLPIPDGCSIYIIVKTSPQVVPGVRSSLNYTNKVNVFNPDTNKWVDGNSSAAQRATQTIYSGGKVEKYLGGIFNKKGGSLTKVNNGGYCGVGDMSTQFMPDNGTYIAWLISVNHDGSLDGYQNLDIIDQVPEGLELAYMRTFTVKSGVKTVTIPQTLDGYDSHYHKTYCQNVSGPNMETWYYSNDDTVRWRIGNVQGESIYQIVFRVTDEQAMFSPDGEEFNNHVAVQREDGSPVSHDNDVVTVKKTTLTKERGSSAPAGKFPFVLQVNPLSEEMSPHTGVVKVVDTMSSSLQLDVSSIQVFYAGTNTQLSPDLYTVALDGQTMTITLPDKQAWTVKYNATVMAKPGVPVAISNNAHWEGYEPDATNIISIPDYKNNAGGSAGSNNTPRLTITKVDANNVRTTLEGAVFRLSEGTFANGVFTPTGRTTTGVTGPSGVLVFNQFGSASYLKYDTVYMLEEIEAPAGYALDPTPHYFAVVKENSSWTVPEGVTGYYNNFSYQITVSNRKGEVIVEKVFGETDPIAGDYHFGLYKVTENPDGTLTEEQVQVMTMTVLHGSVTNSIRFTDLEVGQLYRIYELDDGGSPVTGENALINGVRFDVSYFSEYDEKEGELKNFVLVDHSTPAVVTVTNTITTYNLPATGGNPFLLYTVGILLLAGTILCGIVLYKKRKKKTV